MFLSLWAAIKRRLILSGEEAKQIDIVQTGLVIPEDTQGRFGVPQVCQISKGIPRRPHRSLDYTLETPTATSDMIRLACEKGHYQMRVLISDYLETRCP